MRTDPDIVRALLPAPPETAPPHSAEKKRPKRAPTPQGKAISFDEVEPSPGKVDGPELFAEVSAVLSKYMVLPPHVPVTVSLWIAMTYLTDAVEVMPRLLLSSPTMACGKTRLFSLLGALVWRPVHMVGISPSAMFRLIEAGSPTLLMDEMDNARLDDNPDLRLLLNSGHTRTSAHTYRCANESLEVRRFSTWAPVALAAIGKLPDTVSSRCIRVSMRRRKADEKVERLRESRIRDELRPVCERLARWCQDHAEQVAQSDPDPPEGLSDRDADSWGPLLAVADAIGGDWPENALKAAKALSGMESVSDEPAEVLADMRTVFGELERIGTEDALRALVALEERPWGDWRHGKPLSPRGLAGLLKPYGISSGTLLFGESYKKGFLREWFEDAWKRYTPPPGDSIRCGVVDRENTGPNPLFVPLSAPPTQRQENAVSPAKHAGDNATTDRNPFQGGSPVPGAGKPPQKPAWATSSSDEWYTPPELVAELAREFGPFELDPCATVVPGVAKAPRFFTLDDDGLSQPWAPARVFLNPPFSNCAGFVRKAREEARRGATVVALLPVRADTRWWHEDVLEAVRLEEAEIRYMEGRVRYLKPDGTPGAPPFGSAVVIYRPPDDRDGEDRGPDTSQTPHVPISMPKGFALVGGQAVVTGVTS